MISKIASKVVGKLIDDSVVAATEQELYVYGFFILISQILYFTLTMIFGVLLGIVLESVIFYVAFQFIRRYAGGFHASSEMKCTLITTISIFLCLLCTKLCETNNIQMPILIPTMIAAIYIFILCPLDTPEKPLTKEEYKYFRKISWLILLLIVLMISIGWYFKLEFIMYPCCMSLILESILLVLGKIKRLIKK